MLKGRSYCLSKKAVALAVIPIFCLSAFFCCCGPVQAASQAQPISCHQGHQAQDQQMTAHKATALCPFHQTTHQENSCQCQQGFSSIIKEEIVSTLKDSSTVKGLPFLEFRDASALHSFPKDHPFLSATVSSRWQTEIPLYLKLANLRI